MNVTLEVAAQARELEHSAGPPSKRQRQGGSSDEVLAQALTRKCEFEADSEVPNASRSSSPKLTGMDDLDFAMALSASEVAVGDVVGDLDAEEVVIATVVARSLALTKRCYICGTRTLSPLKVTDPDCMHVACSLGCLLELHDR